MQGSSSSPSLGLADSDAILVPLKRIYLPSSWSNTATSFNDPLNKAERLRVGWLDRRTWLRVLPTLSLIMVLRCDWSPLRLSPSNGRTRCATIISCSWPAKGGNLQSGGLTLKSLLHCPCVCVTMHVLMVMSAGNNVGRGICIYLYLFFFLHFLQILWAETPTLGV